ncbi:MAG: magnesium transporter [DPANN group archaeon]|nr:magnesium transporter [DPANN group archaeon]
MPNTHGLSELADQMLHEPRKQKELFLKAPANEQGDLLLMLPSRVQKEVLDKLDDGTIISICHYLDPDDTTDVIQKLNKEKRKPITESLNKETKEKVDFLLRFNPRTAAGLMNLDFIIVDTEKTVDEVSELIRRHEKRTGKAPAVLVTESGILAGEVPGYQLVIHKQGAKIGTIMKKIPSIAYNSKQNEVIHKFKRHRHDKIAVLDNDKSIMGIIYSDDVLQLMEDQSTKSLFSFAGVSREESALDSTMTKVKYRYKWLILNLFTAFMAAAVVSLFEKTISSFVLLAVYMPIVAGMGGNAGTQALAVAVRGLTLKEIDLSTAKKTIINEVLAGLTNGVIVGVIITFIAAALHQNPLFGFIVGASMIITLMVAGFFGALTPLLMSRLGKDPASSSSIFITTATDMFGFFTFLGLASVLL